MDSLGRLAGGIAHDFNNVLTTIVGSSDLIRALGELSEEQDELLTEILESSGRASELVRHLLTFSRKGPSSPVLLDAAQVVGDMEVLLQRLLGDGIDLTVSIEDNLPLILIDRVHLEQVLLNLAVNARDAMEGRGRLEILLRYDRHGSKPGEVVIEVTDSGPGVPPDMATLVFEPFFTTKGTGEGTGLGLSTVHGIVKSARGEIAVSAAPGGGARFTVRFPAAAPSEEQEKPDAECQSS